MDLSGPLGTSSPMPEASGRVEDGGQGDPKQARSDSSLLRIRATIRQAKAAEALDKAMATPEPEHQPEPTEVSAGGDWSDPEGSINGSTRSVCGVQMAINDLPRIANRVLQQAKGELERSGNLKREIRDSTVTALHTLHEMVLRLSDSRLMHMLEAQKLKAGMARESERRAQQHTRALEALLGDYKVTEGRLEGISRNVESSRQILSHDLCGPMEEVRGRLETATKSNAQLLDLLGRMAAVPAQVSELLLKVESLGGATALQADGLEPVAGSPLLAELQGIRRGLAEHIRLEEAKPPVEDALRLAVGDLWDRTRGELADLCPRSTVGAGGPPVVNTGEVKDRLDSILAQLECLKATVLGFSPRGSDEPERLRCAIEDLRREVCEAKEVTVETAAPLRTALEELRSEVREPRALQNHTPDGGGDAQTVVSCGCESVAREVAALRDVVVTGSREPHHALSYSEMLRREPPRSRAAPHALLVGGKDPTRTADDILRDVEVAVDPRGRGVRVDRVRKVRDGKVILGCYERSDLDKITQSLRECSSINVEEAPPRNPLIEIRDVLAANTDEQILQSLRTQNKHLTGTLDMRTEMETARVRYRMPARNPLQRHVVLEVSPLLWRCLTEAGRIYIGLQHRWVRDRSPLVQCSRCLGYGHPRRMCSSKEVSCAHCGGAHMRADCPNRTAMPSCTNCVRANHAESASAHVAFSDDCPERRKWDAIARSRVAYC